MFPFHDRPADLDAGTTGVFKPARPAYVGRGTVPVLLSERRKLHVETLLIAMTAAVTVTFGPLMDAAMTVLLSFCVLYVCFAIHVWSQTDGNVTPARMVTVRLGAVGLGQTAALLVIVALHAAQRFSIAYPLQPDYPTIGFLAAAALLLFSSPGLPHLSWSESRTSGAFVAGAGGMERDWHIVCRLARALRRPALARVQGRQTASKEAAEDTYDAAAGSGGLDHRYGGSEPAERYLSDWEVVQKSTFDLTLATLLLPLLCPLMLVIAAAIRFESRGPILFLQPRAGLDGRPFTIYKFRTMYHHMADIAADRQTSRGDPRVTRLGRVLRRYSLDELPQLLNVFRGDMSLVGPRPHAPQTTAAGVPFAQAVQEYTIRQSVKPGITGWAQVNGARGEVATIHQLRKRVAYDLFYIMNWSVFFDIKIIVLTIRREVFSQHAF